MRSNHCLEMTIKFSQVFLTPQVPHREFAAEFQGRPSHCDGRIGPTKVSDSVEFFWTSGSFWNRRPSMQKHHFNSAIIPLLFLASAGVSTVSATPLRVLLISGGCCHDYAHQK